MASVVLAFVSIEAVARAVIFHPDWPELFVCPWWLRVGGMLILVSSLLFTLWAVFHLGLMWQWGPAFGVPRRLCTEGPYAMVRHPAYLGLFGMCLGTAFAVGLWAPLWLPAIAALVFAVRIRVEERQLRQAFPDSYPRYCRAVPRVLPRRRRDLRHTGP
jgi:protein-S-isoprenylcysteine O-methyltransferase Ste14